MHVWEVASSSGARQLAGLITGRANMPVRRGDVERFLPVPCYQLLVMIGNALDCDGFCAVNFDGL